jgi:hypothetical protein
MTQPRPEFNAEVGTSVEPAGPKRKGQTPKRLVVTFVVIAAGVAGGTLIANAIGGHNSSANDAMGNWMGSYGDTYLAVSHDVATLSIDGNAPNPVVATVRADCAKLQTDVHQAQVDPLMPMRSLQTHWTSILSNLSMGAQDYINAIDQQNANLLDQTQTYFTNAQSAYVKLAQTVQQVGDS